MQPCKMEHSARSTHRRGHRARHALHRDRRGNMPAVCKRAARWQTTFIVSHDCSLWCCFRFACAQGRADAQMARQSSVVGHDAGAPAEGGPGRYCRAAPGECSVFFLGWGQGGARRVPETKKTADTDSHSHRHISCARHHEYQMWEQTTICVFRGASGCRRSPVARRRHPWRAPPSAAARPHAHARPPVLLGLSSPSFNHVLLLPTAPTGQQQQQQQLRAQS